MGLQQAVQQIKTANGGISTSTIVRMIATVTTMTTIPQLRVLNGLTCHNDYGQRWASSSTSSNLNNFSAASAVPTRGRRPRSVRDTAPDPQLEESHLLAVHLQRAQQSAQATLPPSSLPLSTLLRKEPRRRKLNHAKLNLLSGHEKIVLFKQLLHGGPSYINDAKFVYELIRKNSLLNRLKYIDFHNLFRLVCSQQFADENPAFLIQVWNDWGNLNGSDQLSGIYSTASYASLVNVVSKWGDRLFARTLWKEMARDNVVGPTSSPSTCLPIDSFNQLLALFIKPVHVHPDRPQASPSIDTRLKVSAVTDAILAATSSHGDVTVSKPTMPHKKSKAIPPDFDDVLFAHAEILPALPSLVNWTIQTHLHVLRLLALWSQQQAKTSSSSSGGACDAIVSAYADGRRYAQIQDGLVAQTHAGLRIATQAVASLLDAENVSVALRVVFDETEGGVVEEVVRVFEETGNVVAGILNSGGDGGGVSSKNKAKKNGHSRKNNSVVTSTKDFDMLRKDAGLFLTVALRAILANLPKRKSIVADVDGGVVKELRILANILVAKLHATINCRVDSHAVARLVSIYAASGSLADARSWADKGVMWFNDSVEVSRVRIAMIEAYGDAAPLIRKRNDWLLLRKSVLEIIGDVMREYADDAGTEGGKKYVVGKGLAGNALDALDKIEIVAIELGLIDLNGGVSVVGQETDEGAVNVDEKEKQARLFLEQFV
ncbi:hypothetical protein HK100_010700 [Physocladia obscura]|uniref:Uncharacterized protein n=1 Tax=Physocladia obscura TaxID=109957 RepID=A0AAD5TBP5_9FUNG|nr:hypothetical protein HK100_010700 [Physocladia obscura]